MSSHLNRDSLWELAALPALPADLQAHVATCGDCAIQLAQVKQAQAVLQLNVRPAPPPLDPIAARRIGAVLKEAAEQELAPKGWFTWLRFGWSFAAVAALVLAFLVWNQAQVAPPPSPIAKKDDVVAPVPVPVPPKVEEPKLAVVPTPPPAKLLAKVTGAKKATNQDGKLQKAQTLAEGTQVTTESGGSLWLALPDGSRAGLTGSTALKLDTLEDKALAFTLEKGNVMMVARHLPDRVMTVKAGEVEVKDIGTRFLVSRDVNRVFVAVEEGVVEINAPGTKMTLKAGRSAEWSEGQLREQPWAPPPPPAEKPKLVSPPSPVVEAAKSPETPDIPLDPDEEYALPPNLPKTKPVAPPNPQALAPATGGSLDASVEDEVPVYEAPPEEAGSESFLSRMEKRLKTVKKAIEVPINAVGSTLREQRARDVGRLTDEGNCTEALERAEDWLTSKQSASEAEPRWKQSVMVNQMRCYTRMGKTDEANKIKAQLR